MFTNCLCYLRQSLDCRWFDFLTPLRVLLSTSLPFRTVLELGSGIGFTGIAICKTCNPKTYIFSDYHHRVLQQLKENICLNGFVLEPEAAQHIQLEPGGQKAEGANHQNPRVIVAELEWGSVTEKQLLALQPDVIIAAGTFPLVVPHSG